MSDSTFTKDDFQNEIDYSEYLYALRELTSQPLKVNRYSKLNDTALVLVAEIAGHPAIGKDFVDDVYYREFMWINKASLPRDSFLEYGIQDAWSKIEYPQNCTCIKTVLMPFKAAITSISSMLMRI